VRAAISAALPPDASEPIRSDLRPLGKRRSLPTVALTLAERTEMDETLRELEAEGVNIHRPRTVKDCPPGPCPFFSCRHHLGLEVSDVGTVKLLADIDSIETWPETCSLRVADDGPRHAADVSALLNISLATIQHVEHDGLLRARRGMRRPRQPASPVRGEAAPVVSRTPARAPQGSPTPAPEPASAPTHGVPEPAGGLRLREHLARHGISQAALARELGLSHRHINRICRARQAISADVARLLAIAFRTTTWAWLAPAAGAEPLAFQEGKPAAGAP
jgi:DNA-binding XRE family transcriptional regulator